MLFVFVSSRRSHTRCALVTGVQTCALPICFTSAVEMTKENVQVRLKGDQPDWTIKKDVLDFDTGAPLFIDDNGGDANLIKYRSLVSGPIIGLTNISSVLNPLNKKPIKRIFGINSSIEKLFKMAYYEASKYPKRRVIVETANPSKDRMETNCPNTERTE